MRLDQLELFDIQEFENDIDKHKAYKKANQNEDDFIKLFNFPYPFSIRRYNIKNPYLTDLAIYYYDKPIIFIELETWSKRIYPSYRMRPDLWRTFKTKEWEFNNSPDLQNTYYISIDSDFKTCLLAKVSDIISCSIIEKDIKGETIEFYNLQDISDKLIFDDLSIDNIQSFLLHKTKEIINDIR